MSIEISYFLTIKEVFCTNFSLNLKNIRKNKGFSQDQFSELLGVDREKIRRLEQGKQKSIEFEFLEKIKIALDCSYDDLLK